MIGVELRPCIIDVYRGRMSLECVELIVSGTALAQREEWDRLIQEYGDLYFSSFPKEAGRLIRLLLCEGKIFQPRLTEGWTPGCVPGHWVARMEQVPRIRSFAPSGTVVSLPGRPFSPYSHSSIH